MVLGIIERKMPLDYVVFYDTGMEFEPIYANWERLKKEYGDTVMFVKLEPEQPFLFDMLEREVHHKNGTVSYGYQWCGGKCRWGTTQKLKQIKKFKDRLNDEVTDYVGIAFDEPERFSKAKRNGKVLPLVDWQMTEADCLKYCRDHGWDWKNENGIDLYDILDRVSCWCCANKNKKELRNIRDYLPEYWDKLMDLQNKMDRPFKTGKRLEEIEKTL